ncbi:MAG: tRNA epoxyqueuosine(34) reductase QueG [SAR202 cluster bacterium]|nr:MAG: tRNA epoxyqueuosine(34) reductase QueG [SAR202 cluster bacterium]
MRSNTITVEDQVKECAYSLGFDIVGITGAEPFVNDERAALKRIDDGHMNGYSWYTKDRVQKMNRPELLLEGARSVISLATSYLTTDPDTTAPNSGRVARYAWGDDYHKVLKTKLKEFCMKLEIITGEKVHSRIFVDDGPMNDRAAARRSGVGWFGKNTNILTPSHGSWVFLAQVITDLNLKPDVPLKKTCGNCVRCIDDCPTGAIVAPYVIDNEKCISYLTIELRGAVPRKLRPLVGDWIFGCDICQDVCPVNRKASKSSQLSFQQRPGFSTPDLVEILNMDQTEFSKKFKDSAIKRTKLLGLKRNACIALGNNGDIASIPALSNALKAEESLIRIHAAWALGRIGGEKAIAILENALASEKDMETIDEIRLSINESKVNLVKEE